MIDNDILITIATVAFKEEPDNHFNGPMHWHGTGSGVTYLHELEYLKSRDAIIAVIEAQKFDMVHWNAFFDFLLDGIGTSIVYHNHMLILLAKPRQLCVAFLKTIGKWKD